MRPKPPDRRPRRRRLLDGERQLAAGRLRAVADRRRRARASASCRPPPATPTTTWCASTAASPPPATPATCRCSAATRAPAASRTTSPTHLLAQDLIYVGGGNVVSMLGAWRAHGLDDVLRKAWRKGVVLCGPSAGSLCWFERGAQRLPRRAAAACAGSACCPTPTASTTTPSRRGARSTTASSATACARASPPRTAWRCTSAARLLERVVSSRPDGCAYRVEHTGDGVVETPLKVTYLGATEAVSSWPRPARREAAGTQSVRAGGLRGRRPLRRQASGTAELRLSRSRVSARAEVRMEDRADLRDGRRRLHDGADQPAARRLRALAGAAKEPRVLFLPTASGDTTAQINAFQARFADRMRARAPVAVSPARRAAPAGGDRARAGHHLRRRRIDAQPARDLARARARPPARRGVARGHRAGRPQRRRDVLVSGRRHALQRTARADRRPGAARRAR